ncbi:Hypothetical predicted protein, partial [Pelobates cultripes]
MRWSMVSDKLSRTYSAVSPTSWRCRTATGTILHIFWDCPSVNIFWTQLYEQMSLKVQGATKQHEKLWHSWLEYRNIGGSSYD